MPPYLQQTEKVLTKVELRNMGLGRLFGDSVCTYITEILMVQK